MIGCGSIGQGVLPLILRHLDIPRSQITIITADERGHAEAKRFGLTFVRRPLTRGNYRKVLGNRIGSGDFLLNLSVDVSSLALVEFCQKRGAHYLDTCIEPWPGGYDDPDLSVSERSNYALREKMLKLRRKFKGGATAVMAHGANPGLVSHFVKQALLNIARDMGRKVVAPKSREEWARLAQKLGIKTIHIAERDTQSSKALKKPDEFVNTWSIDGFVSEGRQPAEMGWGTHERHFPHDGARHKFGGGAAIYLNRPGAMTEVRTWTPRAGAFHGYVITHNEAISIADYFSVKKDGKLLYRPTVHYAYHPCDAAILSLHELNGNGLSQQRKQRLLMSEIDSGLDELGVLLMGHAQGAYWYGSQLSIDDVRDLAPYNNATSLQVAVAVLAGMIWALNNPDRGIVEADEIDPVACMKICKSYLGSLVGKYTDWTPLEGRGVLFPEDIDRSDPWQFKNFRVT